MSDSFRLIASTGPREIVVPDIPARELTALAEKELKLRYLERDYRQWDYYTGLDWESVPGRGQKFEVALFVAESTGRRLQTAEIRQAFSDHGFLGHVGAFTQWCRICGMEGKYATVPIEPECLKVVGLRAPYADLNRKAKSLTTFSVEQTWPTECSFVAFRRVA